MSDAFIVDRIEDAAWAVLEDAGGRSFPVPRSWLPAAIREGDVVTALPSDPPSATDHSTQRAVEFRIDRDATAARVDAVRRMHGSLPRGPSGDVSL